MTRMTIGGVVKIQLPDEARRQCEITLVEGDDESVTIRIYDLARQSVMMLSLGRDQPGEITLDGEGYRVLFQTTHVAASEPDSSPYAHVIVTQAGTPAASESPPPMHDPTASDQPQKSARDPEP